MGTRWALDMMQLCEQTAAVAPVISNQALTNRTGHPVVSVPNGFANGTPTALHLTGKLFGEPEILLLAQAFQSKTDFHLRHPRL